MCHSLYGVFICLCGIGGLLVNLGKLLLYFEMHTFERVRFSLISFSGSKSIHNDLMSYKKKSSSQGLKILRPLEAYVMISLIIFKLSLNVHNAYLKHASF